MGAWGVGAFDNDTAGDWLHKVASVVRNGLRSRDQYVARAAAVFTAHWPGGVAGMGEDDYSDAVTVLENLLEEKELEADYRDPAAAKRSIKAELATAKERKNREYAKLERRRRK